jgi:PAS domain S-box-containing protein
LTNNNSKRILVAEDERAIAQQIQQTLAASGYEVIATVGSGEEAVAHAKQTRPDVVVMDIMLSGKLDGISAAQQLQPLGIPVIYLTAYSDRHLLERAQHTEPLAYVLKPAKAGELAAVIKLALFKREEEQKRDRNEQTRSAAAREADEQFRLMVAGVSDIAVFTLDVNGNVNSWNRGAEKISGYRCDQIMGRFFAVLFSEEDRQAGVPQTELEIAEQSGAADDTRWLVRGDGERYWAEGVLTAIRDEEGVLSGFTKITRDATRHKRTQQALESTEEKLRLALRAARMGIWDWDIKRNREYFDDNLRALFQLRDDQQINTIEDFYALLHPDDRDRVVAAFERTRQEGVHLATEFRVRRADDPDIWLLDQGDVLVDEHGEPERMTGACVDITQRKEMEDALRESEERFRLFVNGVQDYALFQMDEAGRILSWNTGAERVLGYSADEIVGQTAAVLFVPEDVAAGEPRKEIDRARETGRAVDERWHIKNGGVRFWCSGVVTRIDGPDGKLRGFAKVMRDDTERQQSREELQRSLAEKEALLKEIHHRVKNNLQVITSLLTLQSTAVEDDGTRALFEEAVNRVRTIGDIHELLYRSPDLARVDFNLYLNQLADHLMSFYAVDRRRIRVSIDGGNAKLTLAQAIPCGLIVNELLTNSLKHAFSDKESGEVQVTLHGENGQCTLTVADNGVGLPPGLNIDNTPSLGLRLVSVLANQLQGELRVHRECGTKFVIVFPGSRPESKAQR